MQTIGTLATLIATATLALSSFACVGTPDDGAPELAKDTAGSVQPSAEEALPGATGPVRYGVVTTETGELPITYLSINGYAVVQGDIVFPEEMVRQSDEQPASEGMHTMSAARAWRSLRWPGGSIQWDNIEPGKEHNFLSYVQSGSDGQDIGEYDYGSIMHYGATDFRKSGLPAGSLTIVAAPGAPPIGQRNGLSQRDVAAVQRLYGLSGTTSDQFGWVAVFEHGSYGGRWQSFGPGIYRADHGDLDGVGNDTISSMLVASGTWVRVCAEANGTSCQDLTDNSPLVGSAMNDRISYIEVRRAVTVFEHTSFGGRKQTFLPGTYDANKGQMSAIGNDAISSMVVPDGLSLTLCKSESPCECGSYTGLVSSLGSMNDQASRIVVEPAVTLYQDASFAGRKQTFVPGRYRANLGLLNGIGNDSASSLVVGECLAATLCDNEALPGAWIAPPGTCATVTGEVNYVGGSLNDKTSYLVVTNAATSPWEVQSPPPPNGCMTVGFAMPCDAWHVCGPALSCQRGYCAF